MMSVSPSFLFFLYFHLGIFSLGACKGYYPVFQNTGKVKIVGNCFICWIWHSFRMIKTRHCHLALMIKTDQLSTQSRKLSPHLRQREEGFCLWLLHGTGPEVARSGLEFWIWVCILDTFPLWPSVSSSMKWRWREENVISFFNPHKFSVEMLSWKQRSD